MDQMDASQAWPPSGGAPEQAGNAPDEQPAAPDEQPEPAPAPAPQPAPAPAPGAQFPPAAPGPQPGQPYPGQPQQPYPGQPQQPYPGQPQPGPYAGQPQQPYPGQPYSQPGQYGGQQYGQPAYYSAPAAKKPMWLFVLIGVVVLALIIGIVMIATRGGSDPSNPGGGGKTPTPTAPAVPQDEVVKSFLEALAGGDAATAISYMEDAPSDSTFLTNQVLAKSLDLGPLTNISVTPATDPDTTWVDASYSLGDKSVNTSYEVRVSGDVYLLTNATIKADVSNIYRRDIGGSINGVSLAGATVSSVELFPGVYQLELDNPLLVLSNDQFTITGPDDSAVWDAEYALAEDAQAKFAAAARSRLRGCIAEKKLWTSCEFGVPNPPGKVVKSSINWSISSGNSDFSKAKFELYDATSVIANKKVSLNCKWRTTGARYKLKKPLAVKAFVVDFSDPDNLVVSLRY